MDSRAGYVLTGGRSSRFGSDKALADLNGRPMVLHVADSVREAAGSVTLVGAPERYRSLGLPAIPDLVEGAGPLAGLTAALAHAQARYALVVACDMPAVGPAFLNLLFETAESTGAAAVVPLQPDGRRQPLCAVYSPSLTVRFSRALSEGDRRADAGLTDAEVHWLEPAAYAALDPDGLGFSNVNTESDFERSRRQSSPQRS